MIFAVMDNNSIASFFRRSLCCIYLMQRNVRDAVRGYETLQMLISNLIQQLLASDQIVLNLLYLTCCEHFFAVWS